MKVRCISGHEGLLVEGEIYTVKWVTNNGNFILEEVEVPEPFTSFKSSRFELCEGPLFETTDNFDEWTEELEEKYWEEQVKDPFLTEEELV